MLWNTHPIALVDLSNIVHRLYHVHKANFAPEFVRWLASIRTGMLGREFIFAVEGCGTERRKEIYPDYKATRTHDPEIEAAIAQAITILRCCSCKIIKALDGEADDAIAAQVYQTPEPRYITIVTRDRDLWQLIGPGIVVKSFAPGDPPVVDIRMCSRKLGVEPAHVPMLKALLGDKSDNIPRAIPKVKTKLLTALAARAMIPDQIDAILQENEFDKVREAILAGKTTVQRNWLLTKLMPDVKMKQKTCSADASKLKSLVSVDHTAIYGAVG
jgi:5'-3' exonuclease